MRWACHTICVGCNQTDDDLGLAPRQREGHDLLAQGGRAQVVTNVRKDVHSPPAKLCQKHKLAIGQEKAWLEECVTVGQSHALSHDALHTLMTCVSGDMAGEEENTARQNDLRF